MEPRPARPPDRLLLPLAFDPALLRRDLDGLSQVAWVDHFVSQNYRGDWSVIPLRAKAGATHPVMMIASDPAARAFEDTPLLAGCPYFRQVLAAFACPLLTVRLMRLGPGSTILEHRDHDLGFEDGVVRIHIPVVTNRDVDFRLNGRRIDMAPGSAWYLRLSDPHSVANRGATSRVHLVIDAIADAWVAALLARAVGVPRDEPGEPPQAAGRGALDRFRALVLAEPALAERLRAPDDAERFVALVVETAAGRGLIVGAEEATAAMRETARAVRPIDRAGEPILPPGGWLPAAASWRGEALWVHWTDFGPAPLSEPFFEQSVARALRKPFNRLFAHGTPIEALARAADAGRLVPPDGFVFHMSRCGSTLVSQMLAALPGAIAISEAGPIETVVAARRVRPDLREDEHARWLAWMIGALGRARRGDERRCFVKLDAWHALDLPLFRRAFPATPWIFLYRDPVEALVSQLRRRGMQMTPPLVAAERFGLEAAESWLDPARYCARVLAAICAAAADGLALGGGLLVDYAQLPDAVATAILPHFGVVPDDGDRAAMAAAAARDAKNPGLPFAANAAAKQREASAEARALAEQWLGGVHRRLEALRLGAPAP